MEVLLQSVSPYGAIAALGIAIATWVRTRPAMKAAQVQGEAALWKRIEALEVENRKDREACEERIVRIETRHETDQREMKAEIRVLRHDRNNVRQALNAMFVMLRREGADVPQIVAAVEDLLKKGDEVIAVEKAAITTGRQT